VCVVAGRVVVSVAARVAVCVCFAVCVLDGFVYALGGFDGNDWLREVRQLYVYLQYVLQYVLQCVLQSVLQFVLQCV